MKLTEFYIFEFNKRFSFSEFNSEVLTAIFFHQDSYEFSFMSFIFKNLNKFTHECSQINPTQKYVEQYVIQDTTIW